MLGEVIEVYKTELLVLNQKVEAQTIELEVPGD